MDIVKDNIEDMEVVDPQVVNGNSLVYDPSKQYTWDGNVVFELSGKEFGLWLNSIRAKVSSKEAMEHRMNMECNNVIEAIMARGVASGIIVEVPISTKAE